MNKDVIYIDVDDDITAIIGKVKDSKEKIVALVPPKRIGVFQSAVNLRLLQRAATSGHKHLVLITNNQALMALAASAKLPVAKNAQSKPEIPEIAALEIDDGEDVIDGAELPVGDHARIAGDTDDEGLDAAASSLIDGPASPASDDATPKGPRVKRGPKVPDFNLFRKKLALGIVGAVAFVAFLIWAFVFAPHATVIITARTSDVNVSKTIGVSTALATDFSGGTIKAVRQEKKKTSSVEFDATGQKDIGEKARGTVNFTSDSFSALSSGITIPAGTILTSQSGKKFSTDATVVLNLSDNSDSSPVTAVESGSSYNAASGAVSGAPSTVDASFAGPTSGGTTKVVSVVTAQDVQKAAEQLSTQEDQTIKSQLKSAFGSDVTVIDSSYKIDKAAPVSTPAVGQEASGKAKLSTEITYSILGVSEAQLTKYLTAAMNDKIADQPDQRVYNIENTIKKASFTDFQTEGDQSTVRLIANGKVGPDIKDDDIKEKVKGKRFGDIQADLETIQGVDDIDVKFFPFWVSSVPNDNKKITIEFKVND